MTTHRDEEIGALLALIVHDLRNPAAAISANASFLGDVLGKIDDADAREAFDDVKSALSDLVLGLEQVSAIAQWLSGRAPALASDGDVLAPLRALHAKYPHVVLECSATPPVAARCGNGVARVVEILLANSAQHARSSPAKVVVRRDGARIAVEVCDGGAALAPEYREAAFTLAGQQRIKGELGGRYGRVAGLLVVRLFADAMGATVEADGTDGAAVFRLWLDAVE